MKRLRTDLRSLQRKTDRVISFFHLPDTECAVYNGQIYITYGSDDTDNQTIVFAPI